MPIKKQEVLQAAQTLRAEDKPVTTLAIRERLGGGSCVTINQFLRELHEKPLAAAQDEDIVSIEIKGLISEFSEHLEQTLATRQNSEREAVRRFTRDILSLAKQEQSELASALDKLISEHETLLAEFNGATRELSAWTDKAITAEQHAQLADARYEEIRAERNRLRQELQAALRRYDKLHTDHEKASEKLNKLQSHFGLEKGAHQQTAEQRDSLRNELHSVIQQRDEQMQARQKAESRAERATADHDHATAAIRQLEHSNQKLKQAIASLERQHSSLNRDHQQLSQSAQIAKANSVAVGGERDRLLLENKSLNQRLNALMQENRKLHDELGKLNTQFELEKSAHQQSKKQYLVLGNQLRESARRIQELKQIHATVENRLNRLEEANQQTKEKNDGLLRTIESERDTAQKKFSAEYQAHQTSEKLAGELRLELARKEAELQKTARESELEIATLQKKISQLQQLVDKNLEPSEDRT